jgi:cell division protein FtsW
MDKASALPKPNIRLQPQTEQGRADYWLLAVVACLLILGTILVYSASFVTAARSDGNPSYYLWRHLLWVGLGLAGGFVMFQVDYHRWRRITTVYMMVVLALLLAVLMLPSQFAPNIAGARRWIALSSDSNWLLQPSELAKLALILYGAHWLSSKGDKVKNFYYGLVPFALTVGFLIALIMGEPDLGTSLVIGAIGVTMFFVAGANLLHMFVGLGVSGGAFYVLATTASYRLNRIAAYKDPFSDPTGLGYHTSQALLGLGSGGVFGVGLGMSRQKFMWLPTVFTDSIFAVIGEELGLIGTSLVVILFLAFAWRGFQIAVHAPDGFGRLIASGVTIYVVAQAFLNIAVVTNLVPFTGIPLPFISYGGSSLSVTLVALGLLLNVSRHQVANPHLAEIEERRSQERQERDFQREQRQVQREQREAAKKLQEEKRASEQAEELAQAQKRWYERTRAEREAERQREEAEREARRQQVEQERLREEIERGAAAVRRKQAQQRPPVPADNFEEQARKGELPDLATRSYLDYRSDKNRVTVDENQEHLRPKLRRPRRDWAKAYMNAAQRKRDN